MSDAIKHECGIALLRLKKDLTYYLEKYGTAFYGLNKMQLLMEKQHNRGQDGAGIANIKLDMNPVSAILVALGLLMLTQFNTCLARSVPDLIKLHRSFLTG